MKLCNAIFVASAALCFACGGDADANEPANTPESDQAGGGNTPSAANDVGTLPNGPTQGMAQATETNVAPAVCTTDEDCGSDIACVEVAGGVKICDVDDMAGPPPGSAPGEQSADIAAAPALCDSEADCPSGVACVEVADGVKICNMDDAPVSPPPPPGSLDPLESASCTTDADCPEGDECVGMVDEESGQVSAGLCRTPK